MIRFELFGNPLNLQSGLAVSETAWGLGDQANQVFTVGVAEVLVVDCQPVVAGVPFRPYRAWLRNESTAGQIIGLGRVGFGALASAGITLLPGELHMQDFFSEDIAAIADAAAGALRVWTQRKIA